MFSKSRLFVFICFCFAFGCKYHDIDYGALDDGGDRPPSAWALIDLFLLTPSSERGTERGEILLRLPDELRHESNFGGINTQFIASESIVFAAPDATTNEAVPDSDTALIDMLIINLVDAKDKSLCPEGSGIAANLVRHANESSRIIFQATDLSCGGNKLVRLSKLVGGIDDLGFVPSHTWKSADADRANQVLQEVEEFYAKENKEGGALQKTQHAETNELIDVFLVRRKMLQGYVTMRQVMGKQDDLKGMADEVFDKDDPDTKHVVIPAVLNGFLNPQVNRVDPEDTAAADSDDFDTILMKEALLSTVLKFLQYQHMFQAEEFQSTKYNEKFVEEKNKFSGELHTYIDEVERQFNDSVAQTKPINDSVAQTKPTVYRNVNDISSPLNTRITNLNTFLKDDEMSCAEYTCQRKGGNNCRKTTKRGVCEDLTARFYDELMTPSCKARNEKVEHNDLYVLLMTQKIMGATRINRPCEKYNEAAPIKNIETNKNIIDGILALKKRTSENLKTLAEIHKKGGGSNFRQKLFENHYYALIPAITKYPDKADEIAVDLKAAHDNVYKKRKKDEDWQNRAKILLWIAGGAAALGIVFAIIPPLSGISFTIASTAFSAASVIGGMSVVAGAALLAVTTSDWRNEKREFQELERAIYGGGQRNAAAQAAALREWHQARTESIIEGLSLGVAIRPAYLLVRGGPQAFRAFFPRNLQRIKRFGGGVKDFARHPIQGTKGLATRTKDFLSGQRIWGLKRGANAGDDLLIVGDDILKTGDDVADGLRASTKQAKYVENELVRYNQAVQEKASMVKDLKKLRKSFFGIGKSRGVSRVTDSGDVFFNVKKEGLPDRRFKKIEKFFKEKAALSGGKLKFEHIEEGARHRFRLLHANRDVALKRAKLAKLQTKLGKGIPKVEPNGSMHFIVKRAGTPPAQLKKIDEVFKAQEGFQLRVANDFGEYRRYSLVRKSAP